MSFDNELEDLRQKINDIDREMVDLISQRADLVRKVGNLKQENEIEAYAANREKIILQNPLTTVLSPMKTSMPFFGR